MWQKFKNQEYHIRNAQNKKTFEVREQYKKDTGFGSGVLEMMANHRSVSSIQILYAVGDSVFGPKK